MTGLGGTRSRYVAIVGVLAGCLTVAWSAWPALAGRSQTTGFRRACSTQPSGVSLPAGYRTSSVTTGPLSLYSFGQLRANGRRSTAPASRFHAVGAGRYRVYKLWALLPPARSATLSVPATERSVLSLAYDPGLWGHAGWDGTARVAQGATSVTFLGCPRSKAQGQPPLVVYDGGLVAAGPRCARLEMRAPGWSRPRTIVVALGRRQC